MPCLGGCSRPRGGTREVEVGEAENALSRVVSWTPLISTQKQCLGAGSPIPPTTLPSPQNPHSLNCMHRASSPAPITNCSSQQESGNRKSVSINHAASEFFLRLPWANCGFPTARAGFSDGCCGAALPAAALRRNHGHSRRCGFDRPHRGVHGVSG